MSWGSARNGRAPGRDDGTKTAKWMMKQAEKTDQQTVFLLNLLQEHRLEIEARDDVMRESSRLILKFKAENESLKQQLQELEQRNVQEPGSASAGTDKGPRDPSRFTKSSAQQAIGSTDRIYSNNYKYASNCSSSSSVCCPPWLPSAGQLSVGRDCVSPPHCTSGGSSDSHDGPLTTTCSALRVALARLRVTTQTGSSSVQSPSSSYPTDALPSHLTAHQPDVCEYAPGGPLPPELTCSLDKSIDNGVEVPFQGQGATAQAPGARRHTPETVSQTAPQLSQQQVMQPTRLRHATTQNQVIQQYQSNTELEELQARFASLSEEVEFLREQLKKQQQPQQKQQQPTHNAGLVLHAIETRGAALTAEVSSLRCALDAAKQEAATVRDKYLTCKKDLEVLTHKYNNLMLQKLDIEEEHSRLFHPDLDIVVLRQAMPVVDAAMADLEERLQEVMGMLASNREETEDAMRAHNTMRRKWIAKLEDLQTQLAERDAKLREAEVQMAAVAGGSEMRMWAVGSDGKAGLGVGRRLVEGEASSGSWAPSPDAEDRGLWRAVSDDGVACGGGSGDGVAGIVACCALVGTLSST